MKRISIFCLAVTLTTSVFAQDVDALQDLYAKANERLQEGSYKNAVIDYNQLVNSKFDDGKVYLNRGIAHYHLGEFELAAKDFDQAYRQQLRSALLIGYRGMVKYQLKDYQGAGSDLEQAAIQGFADPEGLYQLANIKFQQGRYKDAVGYYDKSNNLGLESAALFNNRGKAKLETGEADAAISDFDKAISSDSQFLVAYRNRAAAYISKKNWKKAVQDLDQLCEQGEPEDLFNRGEVNMQLARYEEAISDFKRAEAGGIESSQIHPSLASAYFELEDFSNAAVFYDKIVRRDPSNLEAWESLGIALYQDDQFDQARIALDKAIERGSSSRESYGYRGMSLYRLGNKEEAFEDLTRISNMGFTNEDAYYFLGEILIEKGKFEPAIVQLNKGIAINPEKCGALEARARAYSALDEHANAIRDIEKALTIEDEAHLHKTAGLIQFKAGNSTEAIREFDKAIEGGINEPGLYFLKGEAFRTMGDFENALSAYNKSTGNEKAHLRIAECQYQLENFSEAYKAFKATEANTPIPSELIYSYAHSAFLQEQYARVLNLAEGLPEKGGPVEIARMRAVSHYHLKQFNEALAAAKNATADEEINRIAGLSAYKTGNKAEVIVWLEKVDFDEEVVTALAKSALETEDAVRAEKYLTWLIDQGFDEAEYFVSRAEIRMEKDIDGALSDLGEALARDSKMNEARMIKSQIHFGRSEWTAAITELNYLRNEQYQPGKVLYMLGISQLESGDRDNARASLEAAKDAGSREYRLFAELGTFAFEDEQWETAIGLLTTAIQQDAAPGLMLMRGQAYFSMGEYDKTIKDLSDLQLEGFAPNYALGKAYYETDNHQDAATTLEKAYSFNPESGETAYLLGNSRFLLKDYKGAIDSYLKAVTNDYKEAVLYNNLGKAYEQQDDREDAISAYSKALELDPAYDRALQNRGIAFFQSGNYEGAIGDLVKIDAQDNDEVNYYLAESYYRTSDFKVALAHYNRAIEAGRKDGDIYHKRGRTYIELDQAGAALSDINLAIKAGKTDASVYMDRARVNIYMGNERGAMTDLNEAISKDTDNPDAYYNRGYLRELQENFTEAISDYKKVMKLNPEDDKTLYSLANCTVSTGNLGGGLTYIDQAIELNDGEASYFKVKGNILYRMGREKEACTYWEKAISLGDKKSSFYIDQYCK